MGGAEVYDKGLQTLHTHPTPYLLVLPKSVSHALELTNL